MDSEFVGSDIGPFECKQQKPYASPSDNKFSISTNGWWLQFLPHYFNELYYILFQYGLVLEELKRTQIKFAPVFFAPFLYPFMWHFSLEVVIRAGKDPRQRRINWQILKYCLSAPLLFSDNIVVKARKKTDDENRPGQ